MAERDVSYSVDVLYYKAETDKWRKVVCFYCCVLKLKATWTKKHGPGTHIAVL